MKIMNWNEIIYVPQAKWKFGERNAIGRQKPEIADRIVPLFRLPPPGDFDPELGKTITPELYLKSFGGQLHEARGRRPSLLDGTAIQELTNEESGDFLFAELLERAQLMGGRPIPVFSSKNTNEYCNVACRFARRHTEGAACLRIDLSDLEFLEDRKALLNLIDEAELSSRDCVLLVDAGGLNVSDIDQFTQVLASHFARLVLPEDWQMVVWSSTSFPEKIKLKAGQSQSFERTDWKVFRRILEMGEMFPVNLVFSDYLLEFADNLAPFRATPTAQLRYSIESRYLVFKGESVRTGQKYGNIFPVARALVGSGIFKGESYSKGDEYIKRLTNPSSRTGHAGTWRWCSNDHHIALVTRQISAALGVEIEAVGTVVEPDQLQLIQNT